MVHFQEILRYKSLHPTSKIIASGFYVTPNIWGALSKIGIQRYPNLAIKAAKEEDCPFDEGDATLLLMGSCNMFAKALVEKYGYTCLSLIDQDGKLIHDFCVSALWGEYVFIDVRGMTNDLDSFLASFPRYNSTEEFFVSCPSLIKAPSDDDIDEKIALEFAREIINEFPSYYSIRCLQVSQ